MKIRAACFGYCWLALSPMAFGQVPASDSQAMGEILTEIRAIHEDMRVTQTTQILLTEFEMQQSVVSRATENVDNARSRLLAIQRDQKVIASDLERAEDHLGRATDEEERKHVAEEIERVKANLAAFKLEERGRETIVQQMEQRLQTAQDSLDNIENELNAIIARIRPAK